MHILCAFDKFKDSMKAAEACTSAAFLLNQKGHQISCSPLTDGGEGFCEVLTSLTDCAPISHDGINSIGDEILALYSLIPYEQIPHLAQPILEIQKGPLLLIEMAQTSGLEQLSQKCKNPWHTSSRGTGKQIRDALETNPSTILFGIGGSATNDLGIGLLEALGVEFLDNNNQRIHNISPYQWHKVKAINTSKLIPLPPLRIACDVQNPLTGKSGATYTYGPQKGLPSSELEKMEVQVKRMAQMICNAFNSDKSSIDTPGAGAAGGIAFGLSCAYPNTKLIAGFDLVDKWTGLTDKLQDADLILTGEGSFDDSSLQGKGPYSIIQRATSLGKRSIVLSGNINTKTVNTIQKDFPLSEFVQITPEHYPIEKALKEAPILLQKALDNISMTS